MGRILAVLSLVAAAVGELVWPGQITTILAVAAVVGAGIVCLADAKTAILTVGLLVVWSGWLFLAHIGSGIPLLTYLSSPWSASVLLAISIGMSRSPFVQRRGITLAVIFYLSGVFFAIGVGLAQGTVTPSLSEGLKAVLLGLLPILVIWRARTLNGQTLLALVVLVFSSEAVFALLQYLELGVPSLGLDWTVVGRAEAWWDPRAVFGTFGTLGKNAFGNSITLFVPVFLAVASAAASQRVRLLLLGLMLLAVALIWLSLARTALIAAFTGSLVVGLGTPIIAARIQRLRVTRWAKLPLDTLGRLTTAGLTLLVVAVIAVAARWMLDVLGAEPDFAVRLRIWSALADQVSTRWAFGEGYAQITEVTRQAGLSGLGNGIDLAPPAENLYLRTLLEGGLVGLACLLGSLATLIAATRSNGGGPTSAAKLALRGLVVVVIVESLTSDTLSYQQSAGTFWFLVGVVGAAIRLLSIGDRSGASPGSTTPPNSAIVRPLGQIRGGIVEADDAGIGRGVGDRTGAPAKQP